MTEEMVSHREIAPDVVRVDYANGEAIVVNRTAQPFTVDGVMVPVKDFKLLGKKMKNDDCIAVCVVPRLPQWGMASGYPHGGGDVWTASWRCA